MKSPETFPVENVSEVEEIAPDYSLDKVEHDVVARYQPKFLARGGEHIVYEIPEHPDVVVKADPRIARKAIDWNLSHGLTSGEFPPELEQIAGEYLAKERARFLKIREYFPGHVPNQRKYVAKVPITQSILFEVYGGNPPPGVKEINTIVSVQRKITGLESPHECVVSGYAERAGINEEVYEKVQNALVYNVDNQVTKEDFLTVQPSRYLRRILERAERDEQLKSELIDFIDRSITYTNKTGEVLDLAGSDNVAFLEIDGKWTYVLIDALYPSGNTTVERLGSALQQIKEGSFDEESSNIVLNGLNYIRTINGIAQLLGFPARISIDIQHVPPSRVILETLRMDKNAE